MPFNTTQHVLAIGDGESPQSYARIAQVGDIGEMGSSQATHDTSSHSTNDGWGSLIVGLKRQKPFTVPVWYDPADPQHTFDTEGGLGYMHENDVLGDFIEHPYNQPDAATQFFAYISEIGRPVPVDGVLMMRVTFAPTGKPTHFDATSVTIT